MKHLNEKNFVDKETLKAYDGIELMEVIEELLFFKGVDICNSERMAPKKLLEEIALIHYNLKSNPTNKLYVGWVLDRLLLRNNLASDKRTTMFKVPKAIFDKVKAENDKYKSADNQLEE
jgi:hypothetical protein